MAVDKLVDSTQLDADLTSVANAIRTKGGTSAQMAFPAGFVSAVEAIPSGGSDPGDWTNATKHMGTFTFNNVTVPLPETITVDASSVSETGAVFSFPSGWSADYGYRNILVKNSNKRKMALTSIFHNYYPPLTSPCTITFEDGVTVANVRNCLQYIGYNSRAPYYPQIYGEIDLSELTDSTVTNCDITASHIEFKPNTCSLSSQLTFQRSGNYLDNPSLVSIANVLKDGVSGTITFKSNAEIQIQAIVGRNDTSDGYNKFVADSTGTLTLTDFITTVKGWNLSFVA